MAAPLETVKSLGGEPLDLVLWRNRGRTAVLTEQALELNPGIANYDLLPQGVEITLPAAAAAPAIRETVKLWG